MAALNAPPDAVFAAMKEESLVNGVWFHILSQAFPFPTYIIAPEYKTGTRLRRGDLFVIRVAHGDKKQKAVFAYEGKRKQPPANVVRKHVVQIMRYLKDMKGVRGQAFGALASGTSYCILQWNGSDLRCRIDPLANPPMLIQGLQGIGPTPLSLEHNYGRVIEILRSIEDWISINVK